MSTSSKTKRTKKTSGGGRRTGCNPVQPIRCNELGPEPQSIGAGTAIRVMPRGTQLLDVGPSAVAFVLEVTLRHAVEVTS
jgi:hypothetical protein